MVFPACNPPAEKGKDAVLKTLQPGLQGSATFSVCSAQISQIGFRRLAVARQIPMFTPRDQLRDSLKLAADGQVIYFPSPESHSRLPRLTN